jgi:hypothetical protein
MLPTLAGRVQTRLFLLAVIGGLVTVVVVPLVPGGAPIGDRYRDGFLVLAAVAVLGVVWECAYHLLMQWRWEKDWPTMFGLVTLVPEGVLVWLLLQAKAVPGIVGMVSLAAFCIQLIAIWLSVWLAACPRPESICGKHLRSPRGSATGCA